MMYNELYWQVRKAGDTSICRRCGTFPKVVIMEYTDPICKEGEDFLRSQYCKKCYKFLKIKSIAILWLVAGLIGVGVGSAIPLVLYWSQS